MAAKVMSAQQQIDATLRSAKEDLRELARCVGQAADAHSPVAAEALLAKIEGLSAGLQQHRASIRKWAAQGGIAPAAQSKLAAARTQIESETRKLRETRRALQARTAAQQAGSPAVEGAGEDVSPPSPSLAVGEPTESSSGVEVKVLVEQMQACPRDGDIETEFVCRICLAHLVGCEPKLTRCSHLFCGDCISKWFAAQPSNQTWAGRAQSSGVPCPVCKEPLHGEKDLHPVCGGGVGGSKMLWQMLSATKIVCANNARCSTDGRCDWTGDYASYQQHIAACKNVPICGACSDTSVVSEELALQSEEETEQREEKETANSDSEGTTCADAYSLEDSEVEDAAQDSAEDSQDFDPCGAAPGDAEEQSLSSLIQQLVELKAAQQLTSPKAATVVEQVPCGPEPEHASSSEEELATPASLEPRAASNRQFLPPGVFVTGASTQEQSASTRAQSKGRRAAKGEREQRAGRSSRVDEADRLARAAQAAWAVQAAQAAQWQALQWQAVQQTRMAYAGQVAAQWQMAQSAQMQAARAAWLAQAASSGAAPRC